MNSLVDTNLADLSDILPVEHRAVEKMFIDEFYSQVFVETHNKPSTILQNVNALNVTYKIFLKKVGNIVYISGLFQNISASTILNYVLFDIINPIYQQKTFIPNVNQKLLVNRYKNGLIPYNMDIVLIDGTQLVILDPLLPSQGLEFNGYYFTND